MRTPADVADAMGVSESEAIRQLHDAEHRGLIIVEEDESLHVPPEFVRSFLHLTEAGFAEMYRLQDEQAGR